MIQSKHCWFLTPGSSVLYVRLQRQNQFEQVCRNDEFMEYYGGLLGVESHGKYSWMVHQKGAIRCYDLEKKRFVHQLDFLKDQLKPDDRVV